MNTTLSYAPKEPESLADVGLPVSAVEQLILKILYFRGDLYGQDLSVAIGLKFSVIEEIVEALKLKHHLQVRRSLGMGGVSALVGLTEAGRVVARESLESGMYAGPAPVPLEQYVEQVRRQRPAAGWLTKAALSRALRGLVITERVLSQIGPALSSGNSMLVYGKPGDGKTYLIESLSRLESSPVFVPHAIDCAGNIVRVFDPVYHDALGEEETGIAAVGREATYDRRWVRCKRPFIVSGGELTLDMLDLRYNQTSKIYEAPFQLKANNGIYLVDDFGRQIAAPAAVLNRWIVPMERRVDYLSFVTGGKMTVPFEAFLIFSTNLNPQDLGDEAFLRRMEYKLLLRGPALNEFVKILENACVDKSLPFDRATLDDFIERRYKKTDKTFRRCHPRDVLTHATNLMHFERLPYRLTAEVLDRAYESCFVQEQQDANTDDAVIVQAAPARPCMDYWSDRVEEVDTLFGKLAYLASLRDRASGAYRDAAAEREYDTATVSGTVTSMHATVFRHWVGLKVEQQRRDLAEYLSSPEGRAAFLSFDRRELSGMLTPPDARPEEKQQFHDDLTNVLMSLSQRPGETAAPAPIERIA
ncbi:MAG: hypothetical protein ABI759_04660 [Candidatus Solibacter sp.]